jgi:hypothetical protein
LKLKANAVIHEQMFHYRSKRQDREIGQSANYEDDTDEQYDEQPVVGMKGAR